MKRILFLFTAIALTLASCTPSFDGYQLKGKLDGLAEQEVVLEFLSFENTVAIDTTTTDANGNFKMQGVASESGYYRLISGRKFWIFLMEEKGNLTINADANDPDLKTLTVTGSEVSEGFQSAIDFITEKQSTVGDMVTEFQTLQQSMQTPGNSQEQLMQMQGRMAQLQSELEVKDAEIKESIRDYAASVDEPYTGIYLLSSLDLNKELEFVKERMGVYGAAIPNSTYVNSFNQRIEQAEQAAVQQALAAEQAKKTAVGSEAPNIVMKNPQGQDLSLADLRGKVVLVDFWASWCKPCRFENPNVVATYNKYKNKGFTVFSVSLDKARDPWMAAIQQDNLTWNTHVSDLQFWNNAAAKLYGVQSIPAAFLIDQNGIIVGRDLRGPALEAKVKEIIG